MTSTEVNVGERVHPKLASYLDELRANHPEKCFPGFCPEYSQRVDTKLVLAVLQSPGGSNRVCSINNSDETAKNQRKMLELFSIDPADVLFWNFYPFYGWKISDNVSSAERADWAREILVLATLLTNLRVIVVSGKEAWVGLRDFFEPIKGVQWLRTPLPSNRGLAKGGKDHFEAVWRYVKDVIEE